MITRRLLAAALLLLAACRDSTAPDPGLPGTYSLSRIGGEPLPWPQLPAEGDTAWVLSGTFIVHADDTFVESYNYRFVRHGTVELQHFENSGEYRVIGDSLRLFTTGGELGGRREGRTRTVHRQFEDWVYRRETFPE